MANNKQLNWAHFIAGQAGVVPLSMKFPGVAKSATHAALAKATGRHYHTLCLSQVLPEEMGGFPVVRQMDVQGTMRDVMARIHDERFVRCAAGPSILLLDELTNTGHATQASALETVQEGIPGCWIFAAANPVESAAAGVDLSPPMVNRLCILDWETDRASIREGWRNNLDFPAPNLPLLPANWREFCAKWGILMDRFVDALPDLFESYPDDPEKARTPFATPRSWTNVIKLLGAAESVGASRDVRAKLVWGCVGQGAGTEFLTWVAKQDLPNPEDILADPSSLQLPKRGDLAIAIIASVWDRVRTDNTPDRWEAAFDVLERAFKQVPEVATASEGKLWTLKPEGYSPKNRRKLALTTERMVSS